ncbi:MAG TPA: hypothetical protein VMI56_00060 [Reyranella sp.]|nr:hypothetical protein [Reyranella sp.]
MRPLLVLLLWLAVGFGLTAVLAHALTVASLRPMSDFTDPATESAAAPGR